MDVLRRRILELIIVIPVIIPALVIHEYAHAWMANRCGDPTAKEAGRLTLDPSKHFELMGSIMMLVVFLSNVGFLFGWARPVPVRFGNLRNPIRDMILVAAAGPASNILQAAFWYVVLWVLHLAFRGSSGPLAELGLRLAFNGLGINLILAAFNLLPIPPLDGSRIAVGLLPAPMGEVIARAEPHGFIILMAFLYLGIFDKISLPVRFLIGWMIGLLR